jgi:hypothetical protein
MASKYTLELPDGRKLTVEANDEASAMAGAKEWFAANPAKPAEQQGPPVPSKAEMVRLQFDNMPWYKKAGTAADDIVRLGVNGASFGFADKGFGFNSPEDTAKQRQLTEEARIRSGLAGTVAEIGGGIGTGVGAAGAGLTAARFIPQTATGGGRLAGLMGAGAVDGAAMGALSGAGNTDNGDYLGNVGTGAGIGAFVGGAAPGVVAGLGKAAQPVSDAIMARIAPEAFARRMATQSIDRGGQSIDAIRGRLSQAADDGVPNYTVADAMGDGGARALNGVARGTTPTASRVKEFLDTRQFDQAGRMEGYVREGFGANQTAKQLVEKLTGVRAEKGNAQYGAARAQAGAVNVTPAIEAIDNIVSPGIAAQMAKSGIAETGPINTLVRARGMLTDGKSQLSDFERAFLAKLEMDTAIKGGAGNLNPARGALDDALAVSSPPYAQARNTYRNLSQAIEGVDAGKALAQRGVTQDTADAFAKMSPQVAGGARTGYADALIERLQRGAQGVNGTRSLTSEKFVQDLPVVAKPGRADKMQRQIDREGEMFATRATVTGGSKTANNLADIAAVGSGGAYDFLGGGGGSGTGGGLALAAARRGYAGLGKMPVPEQAAEEIARALLTKNPDLLASMAARQIKGREMSESTVAAIARMLTLGGVGATQSRSQ